MAASLIELTRACKVNLKPRNELDVGQLAMLSSLADEQDGVAPFDLDDRAIAEFHRPANLLVEL